MSNIVKDSSDLNAQIAIINSSLSAREVYRELIVGMFDNIFDYNIVNLELDVEKRTKNGFRSFTGSFFDPAPGSDTTRKLARVLLKAGDSVVNYFHIDSRYTFEIGAYRIKCRYWNDVRNFHSSVESKWTYFKVARPIYARRYFGDNR